MKHLTTALSVLLVAMFLLAACAPAATPTPEPTATPQPAPTATPEPAPQDIVDIAIADGRFTTLVTAVQAAGLVDTLKGEGPLYRFCAHR